MYFLLVCSQLTGSLCVTSCVCEGELTCLNFLQGKSFSWDESVIWFFLLFWHFFLLSCRSEEMPPLKERREGKVRDGGMWQVKEGDEKERQVRWRKDERNKKEQRKMERQRGGGWIWILIKAINASSNLMWSRSEIQLDLLTVMFWYLQQMFTL